MREETRYPGEMRFHYDREAREAGLSQYARRNLHARGFFRRNRSLAITLIDLLVLLLLFVILNVYLRTRPKSDLVEGYAVTSTAYLLEERIYVSLTFERTSDSASSGTVRILLRTLPDDNRVDLSDTLPERAGEARTVHGVLEASAPKPRLFATIDVGDQRSVTEIKVRPRAASP